MRGLRSPRLAGHKLGLRHNVGGVGCGRKGPRQQWSCTFCEETRNRATSFDVFGSRSRTSEVEVGPTGVSLRKVGRNWASWRREGKGREESGGRMREKEEE